MSDLLPAQQGKFQLPKLQDLYDQKDVQLLSKFNDFNKLLNSQPRPEWISKHHIAKKKVRNAQGEMQEVPVEFIPIGIVEYLLTSLFIKWKPEILREQVMANSIVVTIRLHVLNPITMEWEWADGIGAAPIRVDKGASATDFSKVQSSAVQTGAPAAKSYAIRDAADCFGKIFGKDLNRNAEMNYQPMQEAKFKANLQEGPAPVPDELKAVIAEKMTAKELSELYEANPEYHNSPEFMKLMTERKTQLRKKEDK